MRIWIPKTSREKRISVAIAAVMAIGASGGVGLAVASSAGQYLRELRGTVPPEKLDATKRSLPTEGPESPVPAPVPTGRISPVQAAMLDGRSVPVSPSLVRVTNGWMVSNGRTLIAVYAGTAGDDSSSGRFVIVRQDLEKGTQTKNVVTVPGTGAVRITGAPLGAGVESTAQRAQLGYRGGSGARGNLDLATDTVN